MMPIMQVDFGAIKFVLKGSNVMCPGITSPGGFIEKNIMSGSVVVSKIKMFRR
jgi:malignant T-cell-amplified sequence